jgi:hypothetical protein
MKVIVEFELDETWNGLSDEMVWTDLVENEFVGMDGVTPKLVEIRP